MIFEDRIVFHICYKLDALDLYTLAWAVLEIEYMFW